MEIDNPGSAGVTSINSLTGAVTLAAGSNITLTPVGNIITIAASGGGGSGTVTSVASADGSITVTNPTTTVDLAVVKSPKLTTARTINGTSFDGTANITVTAAAGTLTGTTLNATVVTSSLTTIGTIGTGVWNGSVIGPAYGGTGIANNASSTITISGNFATTLTISNTTSLTLPTTGTLATLAGSEALTNKTYNGNTWTAGTGTLTIAASKTLTANNNITIAGTDGKTLTLTNSLTVNTNDGTLSFGAASKTLTVSDSTTLATNAITLGGGEVITFSASNALSLLTTGTAVMTFPTTTDTVTTLAATQTLTNKRRTRRITTTNAPGATPTTNSDNVDVMAFTGLAAAITSMTTNLSGTPIATDLLEFQFTDNGTARAITWGASFVATTVALPTTTVISTLLRVFFEYNGSAWACVGTA